MGFAGDTDLAVAAGRPVAMRAPSAPERRFSHSLPGDKPQWY
jgi:hypothetical protein